MMSDDWATKYSRATNELLKNCSMPAAEAVYSYAATHGLLAIVLAELGEDSIGDQRHLKSARALLEALQVPYGEGDLAAFDISREDCKVRIEYRTLHEAISKADSQRHGRSANQLSAGDVEALALLGDHPALGLLREPYEPADLEELQGEAEDLLEVERAIEYLGLLDDDDVDLRARKAAEECGRSYEEVFLPEPDECPVCGCVSLVALGIDGYGIGISYGTCVVCSYRRSRYIADREAMQIDLQRIVDKD